MVSGLIREDLKVTTVSRVFSSTIPMAWPRAVISPHSLLGCQPSAAISADTASERIYLPETLKNKLLLADAGYLDFSYFDAVDKHNGVWNGR